MRIHNLNGIVQHEMKRAVLESMDCIKKKKTVSGKEHLPSGD